MVVRLRSFSRLFWILRWRRLLWSLLVWRNKNYTI